MTTVAAICLTALVIAWLGRGAHDGRLRLAARRMELEAGKREADDAEALTGRVTALERRAEDQEKQLEQMRLAASLAKVGRR